MRTAASAVLLLSGVGSVFAIPNGQSPNSFDKRISLTVLCGGLFGLSCTGSIFGSCCSEFGICGSSAASCSTGCQTKYGTCNTPPATAKISLDGTCGGSKGYTCKSSVFGNCCSQYGYCGSVSAYCEASCQPKFGTCASTTSSTKSSSIASSSKASSIASSSKASSVVPSSKPANIVSSSKSSGVVPSSQISSAAPSLSAKVSTDGSCGGTAGNTCMGSVFGDCCSSYGYCGSTDPYCGVGCQIAFGTCPTTSLSFITASSGTKASISSSASIISSAASSSSTISSSTIGSNSTSTCHSTPTPTAGRISGCIPCQGQPGKDQYCGYDINTNYYENVPKTCKVITYEFDITEVTISPDGIARPAMIVNGGMPGPLIHASWGDTVVVKVTNHLTENGTSIHFHGVRQLGNNMNDGVPSITQCPIPPSSSMTYTWVAEQYGTSWWHSHFAIQTGEGVFGPIIIDGPSTATYDTDLGTLIVQDWTHRTVDSMYQMAENAAIDPATGAPFGGPQTMDTGLLNGKNVWIPANTTTGNTTNTTTSTNTTTAAVSGERTVFENIVPGKKYRLRIINAAIQSTYKIYIDGHSFEVIESDFVPIVPYTTNLLSINIGQRYDIIVTADQTAGAYWLRADNQEACAHTIQNRDIKALFTYTGFSGVTPTSTGPTYTDACVDEPLASLIPQVPLNAGPADIPVGPMTVAIQANSASLFKWYLNGVTFFSEYDDPTLLEIEQGNPLPTYSGSLLIELPTVGKMVYIIVQSPIPLPHPIHLHGHDFWILGEGDSTYSNSTQLNFSNPPRRDTALLPAAGFLVIGFVTDNPGVWLAHCHIGWHTSMGFALQFVEMQSQIASSGVLNNSCALTGNCAAWSTYATSNGIVVEDSGV